MFGYITPLKPELKIKDFAKFRSYYCGLCFHLKSNAGNIPRIALNYDMTFLAVLLDSISLTEPTVEIKRCFMHPLEKKPVIINNEALSFSASINIALYYYKIKDDIYDDKDLKSILLEKILKPYFKKGSSITKINSLIESNLKDLSNFEKNKNFNFIDEIAHPFSDIVGIILKECPFELVNDSEELRNNLYNFGYTLGKWIYLIDAFDDLEDDIKNKKFNPINHLYNKENYSFNELLPLIKERLEFSILNCSYNCNEILKSLPLKRNEDILKNILELGMMDKYLKISNNTCENKKECNKK